MQIKRQMDKGGHYDVKMKGWTPKGGIIICKLKGGWTKDCIMRLK